MTTTLAAIGDFNGLAVAIFAVVLAITLVITCWAARRTRSATDFYTAGRGVAGAFERRSPPPATTCPPRPSSATPG